MPATPADNNTAADGMSAWADEPAKSAANACVLRSLRRHAADFCR